VADLLPGDVIAIDGKTLRHPCDTAGAEAAIHMVSAWAATQGLCRGQIETEAKPDELAAVPTLLEVLALTGRVVTIDGMGCQTAIARTVGDHTIRETRDFISSLAPDAAHLARIVRSHWAIENGLHRVLDVAMHRDQTRIRTSDAPENLAILHHIPLNLLTQDHDYLLRVIMGAENWVRSPWDTSRHLHQPRAPRAMIPCLALSLRSRADVPSQQ
jgi:predicted transposase YbfD/YdcC